MSTRHRMWLQRALALLVATLFAIWLGVTAGRSDAVTYVTPRQLPTTAVTIPGVPSYDDERWQDPSGYPYCSHPDDGMRPCIDAQTGEVTP